MRTPEELKKEIAAAIDGRKEELGRIARLIWNNPEPGYREEKTGTLGAETLKKLGLQVQYPLALTGFKGTFDTGKPGPGAAILGEMDSLILPEHPQASAGGAVHACGHHTHITALLGAAMGLCDVHAERELSGKVFFIGSPAEECIELEYRLALIQAGKIGFLGGKQELIRRGAFDDCDMAMMLHVASGYNGMDSNGFLKKMIRFRGKGCHAASPQNGINALNAATLALNAIALMRETFSNDPTVRVHGIMTKGGDSTNIIPSDVRLEYQIRANTPEKLQSIGARFDQAMRGCAMALGAEVDVITLPGYMPMHNDRELFALFADEIRLFRNDLALAPVPYFDPGCTDMGDVSSIMPAIHPFFPGAAGACHSAAFHVPDEAAVCAEMATVLADLTVTLLYGEAEQGKKIAARKKDRLSTSEYLDRMERLVPGFQAGRQSL